MLSLNDLEAKLQASHLQNVISEKEAMSVVRENAVDGQVFRRAAEEGYLNIVKFLLYAGERYELTPEENEKFSNEGAADDTGTTPLHLAASRGHSSVVEAIIYSGACVNVVNKSGDTPLVLACLEDHERVVNVLIRFYMLHECNDEEKSALWVAVKHAKVSIVETLLKAGAYSKSAIYDAAEAGREDTMQLLLQYVNEHDLEGETLLYGAEQGSVKLVRFVLSCGVDVNALNGFQRTSVHIAAACGHLEIVRILLSSGADIDAQDSFKRTPLYYASLFGHLPVVQLLLMSNATPHALDYEFCSPLDAAIEKGYRDIALLLFAYNAPLNKTNLLCSSIKCNRNLAALCLLKLDVEINTTERLSPLHLACQFNCLKIAKILLEKGASVNAQDESGNTPLHVACKDSDHHDMRQLLISHGASTNITNADMLMPLQMSMDSSIHEFLIKNGAEAHVTDDFGRTLLHETQNIDLVQLLLQHNVLVDARDRDGSTPLLYACKRGDASIALLLIQHGASVNTESEDGTIPLESALESENPDLVELLLENDADPKCIFSNGDTVLHFACENDDPAIVRLLLEYGALVNAKGENDETPLHAAVDCGNSDIAQILIEHNGDINAADSLGQTPLHAAVSEGQEKLVEYFLRNGANALAQDEDGETPLDLALVYSHHKIAAMLKRHSSDIKA